MSRAWVFWFILAAVAASGCKQHKISMQPGARTFTPESYISVWDAWTREKETFSWKELQHEIHVAATFESWEFRWAYVVRYAYDYSLKPEARDEMLELLSFVGLEEFAEMPAGELSGGQRRLLSLGRAIAMRPKLLMLDEPAAGLSPTNVDSLMGIVLNLKDRYGLTLLIVEHILKVVMDTCDTVTVLDHGHKIGEGAPAEVKDDPAVIEAYLGKEMSDDEVRAAFARA